MADTSGRAVWYGILAVTLAVLSWHNREWHPALRAILTMTALILAIVFVFWLADALIYLLGRMRSAWYFPQVRQLELIARMSDAQLAAIGVGVVQLTKLPVNGRLSTSYRVVGLSDDLSQEAVREWTDYCLAWTAWPDLPALHRFNDDTTRAELRAYTVLVVALNLADPAGANVPARWKVDAARIAETLEI